MSQPLAYVLQATAAHAPDRTPAQNIKATSWPQASAGGFELQHEGQVGCCSLSAVRAAWVLHSSMGLRLTMSWQWHKRKQFDLLQASPVRRKLCTLEHPSLAGSPSPTKGTPHLHTHSEVG